MVELSKPRTWLSIALALIFIKIAITGYYIAGAHQLAPLLSRPLLTALFWASKVTPAMFCACLALWARLRADRSACFYEGLFVASVIYTIIVLYAMHQGWRGVSL